MISWIYLLIAGVFEIGFTTCLKLSDNFTKIYPTAGFIIFAWFSFTYLNYSLKTIPIGTAYAIWTGIGAFGTAVIGIMFFKESIDFWRIFFLSLIIISIVGLKLTSPH